ncbi:MAG: FKBP-type peptidyl-prolyl cis-trans isomerase [Bacteroidales bacterium]|nr:FKBP-type peptidyl-prolyl cis-trans isomerase [Bacteroidales bacterium]
MKLSKILTIAAATLAIVACGPKVEGSKEVQDLLPKASQIDSASYLIGINFGAWIKGNNFGELNYSEVVKGIKDFIKAEGDQRDSNFVKQFKISPMEMQEVLDSYLAKRRDYTAALNKEKAEAFFAANAEKDSIQVTESGLQYKIIEPGSDLKPVNDKDTIWVNYKGTLLNGDVFDESNGEPVRLFLNRVVKGWSEGLKLIGEGGKIQLFVPAELGYGEYGTRGIEPNSALIFDVELTKVGTFVEKPEEPAKGKKK